MKSQRALFIAVSLAVLVFGAAAQSRRVPGEVPGAGFLLPNGWTISPAGEQIRVGDLPLALVLHPDGRHLLVSNNGNGEQSIDVVDMAGRKMVSRTPVQKTWLGLAVTPDGKRVFASGGISNTVLSFSFDQGRLTPGAPIRIGRTPADIYPGGLCVSRGRLFVANNLNRTVSAVDLASGSVVRSVEVGDHPYTCVASPTGDAVYVSLWGAAQVAVVDPETLELRRRIATDDHPNAMVFTPDGSRLFVANANSNTVSAIDVAAGKAVERISVALYPGSPAGSTPNALALSPDGKRLYVANADNNDLAVADISEPGKTRVLGFIPTGWYPTAVVASSDGKMLYVANGKGGRSLPNPKGPQPTVKTTRATEYVARLLQGTVSLIPAPDEAGLARHTERVYANAPYTEKKRLSAPFTGKSAVPSRVGDASLIKHVIYIVKENRTYDQVFGDMKEGNGDPSLTLFGEEITPNHHALAREYVLLDNFYCDAEVSADGHNWSMGAYATDYVEKTWPSQYSGRRRTYDYEGTAPIAAPSAGYIWDACARASLTYRSYGEFVVNGATPRDPGQPRPSTLQGHIDPYYRGWDLEYSDVERVKRFLSELERFEKEGDMPRFQVMRLPNDHTMGTRPGSLTPRSYVAQNDVALGMLIEGLSRSKFWKSTAVFSIEDDAQNGPDHVDAHRTVALVISPYSRHRGVDSAMYSTSSMLRTIELILGLPPMSQYDAAAAPMFASLGAEPDLSPYKALPARVPLTDINPPDAPGAAEALRMNFEEADAAPDIEFNELIWKSVRGTDAVMPAPVRSAFVRPLD